MHGFWAWVVGAVVGVFILGLLVGGHPGRQSYWAARSAPVHQQAQVTPAPEPTPRYPQGFLRR